MRDTVSTDRVIGWVEAFDTDELAERGNVNQMAFGEQSARVVRSYESGARESGSLKRCDERKIRSR